MTHNITKNKMAACNEKNFTDSIEKPVESAYSLIMCLDTEYLCLLIQVADERPV